MGAVSFKVNTAEFQRTLRRYREFSKRDLATIVNTKALFIARRALRETPKADKAKIAKELGRIIKTGKNAGKLRLAKGSQHDAPLAALIINKRLGTGRGLRGEAMAKTIRSFIASRMRSIAFLKSGWIPAIKALSPFAELRGAPRQGPAPVQYGRPKGSGTPARGSTWNPKAIIENAAGDNKENRGALITYGGPALQAAVDAETASMKEYIGRKLTESAAKAGIRTG